MLMGASSNQMGSTSYPGDLTSKGTACTIPSGAHNSFLVERRPTVWPHEAWIAPTNDEEKLELFATFAPELVEMILAVPCAERWALFHRPRLDRWSKGRATLIGDAARAMVPHHGQGANQSSRMHSC